MLVVSNWKMNLLRAEAVALLEGMAGAEVASVSRMVLPPYPLLPVVAGWLAENKSAMQLGGQDCHSETGGAYTGDVAATMLADAGCGWVLAGHSERRQQHRESNALIASKIAAARVAKLGVILCVGETEDIRAEGDTAAETHVGQQLVECLAGEADMPADALIVAYEPVWAIGSGRTPSTEEIAAMHNAITAAITGIKPDFAKCAILYGGSVNPANAASIASLAEVNGVLVGGASLKADAINAITAACGEASK